MLGTSLSNAGLNGTAMSAQMPGSTSPTHDGGVIDLNDTAVPVDVDSIELALPFSDVYKQAAQALAPLTAPTLGSSKAFAGGEAERLGGPSLAASGSEVVPLDADVIDSGYALSDVPMAALGDTPVRAQSKSVSAANLEPKVAAQTLVNPNVASQSNPQAAAPSLPAEPVAAGGDVARTAEGLPDHVATLTENRSTLVSTLTNPVNFSRTDSPLQNLAQSQALDTDAGQAELGSKLQWMSNANLHRAQLTLSPSELGPVEIQLRVGDGEAAVQFFAANPSTRDALEQAMPRLREMLAEAGLNLTDGEVFQERPDSQSASSESESGDTQHRSSVGDWDGETDESQEGPWHSIYERPTRGRIDQFA